MKEPRYRTLGWPQNGLLPILSSVLINGKRWTNESFCHMNDDTNNITERLIASAGSNNGRNALRCFRRDISLHRLSLLCEGEGEGGVKIIGFIRRSPDDSFQLSTFLFTSTSTRNS